uniref:Uncharacterized protein n=1 Tax=Pipistrellus kuhlii TaxID=59472 RepID=A0A7J7VMX1_PIPKU|nr:hypothetical protein mPipKuh1_008370 [Pipistrellus kuhlii]
MVTLIRSGAPLCTAAKFSAFKMRFPLTLPTRTPISSGTRSQRAHGLSGPRLSVTLRSLWLRSRDTPGATPCPWRAGPRARSAGSLCPLGSSGFTALPFVQRDPEIVPGQPVLSVLCKALTTQCI